MAMFVSTFGTLQAQTCDALLKDLMEHCKNSSTGFISYQIVGLGGANYWGQYTEGELYYSSTQNPQRATIESLSGDNGLQYFSDRFAPAPNTGGGFNISPYWFNKSNPDKLKLTISRGGLVLNNACRTPVTLTLLTCGNAKSTFCPVCKGEFMYLLENGMVIRFNKRTGPR